MPGARCSWRRSTSRSAPCRRGSTISRARCRRRAETPENDSAPPCRLPAVVAPGGAHLPHRLAVEAGRCRDGRTDADLTSRRADVHRRDRTGRGGRGGRDRHAAVQARRDARADISRRLAAARGRGSPGTARAAGHGGGRMAPRADTGGLGRVGGVADEGIPGRPGRYAGAPARRLFSVRRSHRVRRRRPNRRRPRAGRRDRCGVPPPARARRVASGRALHRRRTRRRDDGPRDARHGTGAAALAIVIAVGVGGSFVRARLLARDPEFRGGGFREQFYAASVRMMAARPLAGVGAGQYAASSMLFLSPQLAWSYGNENAHNYFLQIGGELGIPGLALFLVWTGAGLTMMGRSLERGADPRLLGTCAGIAALLMTCATGHPLLVSEVAFPFWIQFGLALALALSPLVNASMASPGIAREEGPGTVRTWRLRTATVCAGAIVVAVAVRGAAAGPLRPPVSQAVDGLYPWEKSEDGRNVRWTEEYGSVFVPADTKRIYIPARIPADTPLLVPMPVYISIGGRNRTRVLVGSRWGTLDVPIPAASPPSRFNRIDLRVDRAWRPALYIAGSYDMRPVGIQIGECELVR